MGIGYDEDRQFDPRNNAVSITIDVSENYIKDEMYLIGRVDGYNACLEDYWAEITSSAAYME